MLDLPAAPRSSTKSTFTAAKVVSISGLELLKNSLGEVKPALSSLKNEKCEVSSYLEKFVDEAKKIVPEKGWVTTPILFLAPKGTDKALMDRVSVVFFMTKVT